MKKILLAISISAIAVSSSTIEAQSYELVSSTWFALRIHSTGLTPQPDRIAGADHSVYEPENSEVILEIQEDKGRIAINQNNFILNEQQAKFLRQGRPIVVNEEFRVTLSSNALDRSRAYVLVQRETSLDKELLYLIEVRLSKNNRNKKKQNKSEMATPRKPSD